MRVIITLLFLHSFAFGEWCVTAVPKTLKSSELRLGTGKDYGLWEVGIRGDNATVSRVDLMERIPFGMLNEYEARDVLNRRAAGDKRTIAAQYLGAANGLGPAGLTYAATRIKNPTAQGALVVVGIVWSLIQTRSTAKAPNPSETADRLFPDAGITLGPQGWDGVVVTGQVSRVKWGPSCLTEYVNGHPLVFDKSIFDYEIQPERDPVKAAWYLSRIMQARSVQ